MSAALLPLYFDTVRKELVTSSTDPNPFTIPTLYQEDGVMLEVNVQKRINAWVGQIYQRISLTGWSVQVSIGTAGVVNAALNTWTPSDDGYSLTGTLELNTAAITALADGAAQILELRLFNGTNYYSGQWPVTIRKKVATAAALVPVPGDTALGALQASRIYFPQVGQPGQGFILVSPDGTKKIYCSCDNDGAFNASPIT